MRTCHAIVLALVAVLTLGIAQAEDTTDSSDSEATPQTACLIDDHLSVWLGLETADRMVASLEKERRELTEKLVKHGETLELMDEGKVVSEGVRVTNIGVLTSAETGSREALRKTYDQLETRITELDKTLKRRRLQRTRLEERLNAYLVAPAADGS